jgi:putative flippase GtrA
VTCPPLLRRLPAPAAALATASGEAAVVSRVVARVPRTVACRVRKLVSGDGAAAQLGRFALVGGLASALHVLLFVALAGFGTQPANLAGAVASSVLANELHRRRTFRAGDRIGWFTAQWQGGGLAVTGMAATGSALALLAAATGDAGLIVQASLVVTVTAAVGGARFVLLRWAFRPRTVPAV